MPSMVVKFVIVQQSVSNVKVVTILLQITVHFVQNRYSVAFSALTPQLALPVIPAITSIPPIKHVYPAE
jgi:cell shape-determining protein MreD